jgi:anti-sigma factor RsiW
VNIFSSHLSFERLVDLVEGRLSPAEQDQALDHLAACARCAAEKTWLEQVIGLMRSDTSEDAPPAVITRARRLFQSRTAPTPTERRRISALLQFDSLQRPLALGVRSGQPAARQLLLKAENFDLDVRITPIRAAWQVSGQILGLETSGQVELQSETTTVRAELNNLGEFTLPPVPAGSYNFLLRLADLDVDLPTLYIGI